MVSSSYLTTCTVEDSVLASTAVRGGIHAQDYFLDLWDMRRLMCRCCWILRLTTSSMTTAIQDWMVEPIFPTLGSILILRSLLRTFQVCGSHHLKWRDINQWQTLLLL